MSTVLQKTALQNGEFLKTRTAGSSQRSAPLRLDCLGSETAVTYLTGSLIPGDSICAGPSEMEKLIPGVCLPALPRAASPFPRLLGGTKYFPSV